MHVLVCLWVSVNDLVLLSCPALSCFALCVVACLVKTLRPFEHGHLFRPLQWRWTLCGDGLCVAMDAAGLGGIRGGTDCVDGAMFGSVGEDQKEAWERGADAIYGARGWKTVVGRVWRRTIFRAFGRVLQCGGSKVEV